MALPDKERLAHEGARRFRSLRALGRKQDKMVCFIRTALRPETNRLANVSRVNSRTKLPLQEIKPGTP